MIKRSTLLAVCGLLMTNLSAQTPCESGFADIYPCENIDLWEFMPISDLGGADNLNDIWGWTDPVSGREFALVGKSNGTAFVDISDPGSPIYLGSLPSHTTNSLWRDVKVFNDHAFIVAEAGNHGMQVFDLTQLPSVTDPPVEFEETVHYSLFGNAHNIAINEESGYAYAVGTGLASGGLHIINIQNPVNPQYAGDFAEDGYTHDAQIVIYRGPDEDYCGREIAFACNENTVTTVDVTEKTDCQLLAAIEYDGSQYSHQGWLTEDHRYFLLGDELDELYNVTEFTKTLIWDVQDLDNPVLIGEFLSTSTAIDHNMYTKDEMVYQSNYRAGLRILDATNVRESELTEVGYFDVQPDDDNASFTGTWSNYPYFSSGNVVVTDMYTGLFILRPRNVVVDQHIDAFTAEEDVTFETYINYVGAGAEITVGGLPMGVTATVGAIQEPGATTITLFGTENLAAGDYDFTVSVNHDAGTDMFTSTIHMSAEYVPIVNNLAPSSGTVDASNLELTWTSNQSGVIYRVEVSEDDTFTSLMVNEEVADASYTIAGPLAEGEYFWRVFIIKNCGEIAVSELGEFQVGAVGIQELTESSIQVYPNPSKGLVTLYSESGQLVRITDLSGRVVFTHFMNTEIEQVDVSILATGTYLVQAGEQPAVKLIIH